MTRPRTHIPDFPGWHLLGAFPDNEPDDVGSWLLIESGEALLLEIPPGLTSSIVKATLREKGATLRFATASHDHEDHFDQDAWIELARAFPQAKFLHPFTLDGDTQLHLGDEPVWLIKAPKHSLTDVVTIFRGVAMTGDIELGMLASVNKEVPVAVKRQSLRWLRDFGTRTGYRVHTTVSAHLNSVCQGVDWAGLFEVALK